MGGDHGGFALKEAIATHLKARADVVDVGCFDTASVDYPDVAKTLADRVLAEEGSIGECRRVSF